MRSSIVAIILIGIFIIYSNSYAAGREWTTQERLSNGDLLTLYWVGVYEGKDTVYKIAKSQKILHLGENNAAGQPITNIDHNLIAFPYCADDGCSSTVSLVDISSLKVLPPIELGFTGQFYINCRWINSIFEIEIEHEPWGNPKGSTTTYKYRVTTKGHSIIK